jgi:hypothetical protein
LELVALRFVKLWLRRRKIPVAKEGGYPSVVWTLMVLHVLRCSLFVYGTGEDSSVDKGRNLLGALAAFFDRFAEGGMKGTLLFAGGTDAEFRPQASPPQLSVAGPVSRAPNGCELLAADLCVLDPTTMMGVGAAWGAMEPTDLAGRTSAATQLLYQYEICRAQRLSAATLTSGEATGAKIDEGSPPGSGGGIALRELFNEVDGSMNTLPAVVPTEPVGVIVLHNQCLIFGVLKRINAKPCWAAPFLHRRDTHSGFALATCDVNVETGTVALRRAAWTIQWFQPCQFVCMATLRRSSEASGTRQAGRSFELEDEGLERWREMCALLGTEEGLQNEDAEAVGQCGSPPPSGGFTGATAQQAEASATCGPKSQPSSATRSNTGRQRTSGGSRRSRGKRISPATKLWRI